MYASHGFLRSDIGDVDVLYHDGQFHLFHLVLPNHDFIAHAVSDNGLNWKRVKNALFVGDPGRWDDDMLWTMQVTPDPDREGAWRMFYTGLSRAEYGRVQRVGVARSDDLVHWTRDNNGHYPLEIHGPHYESSIDEGRQWVSFRDPYFYHDPLTNQRLLLAAARSCEGPLIRRGCVGLAREVAPDQFVFDRPLHRPGLYDDIEVPNLFYLDGRYFLLGSIREDTKVHYWYSDKLDGPYENFFDNVLLPRGNYAARVCKHGDDWLLFNFFAKNENHNGRDISKKLLPPPKLLCTTPSGRLRMKSYPGFDDLAEACAVPDRADRFAPLFGNPHAAIEDRNAHGLHLSCASGYEAFLLPDEHESFRLRVKLDMEGQGKCGLVLRVDEQGDGYYLSLDLVKGVAQLRAWGTSPQPELEHAFRYHQLQAGYFLTDDQTPWQIEVVAHGMYLELSINGYVILSLVDDNYSSGRLGFYAESARLMLHDLTLETLARPVSEHDADMVYTGDCPDDLVVPQPDATYQP